MTDNLIIRRLEEDLDLDSDVCVNGKIIKYLTTFQLNGIRFLYDKFKKGKDCILNDESQLGKTVQVTAFLSAVFPLIINSKQKCLIVCKNEKKILSWMYHLDIFTNIKSTEYLNDELTSSNILIIGIDEIKNKNIDDRLFSILILDETGSCLFNDKDIKNLQKINCKRKIVITTFDINFNITHLYKLLDILNVHDDVNLSKMNEFKNLTLAQDDDLNFLQNIFNFTKKFSLRRRLIEMDEKFPLIDKKVHDINYNLWIDKKKSLENFKTTNQILICSDTNIEAKETTSEIKTDAGINENFNESQDIFKFDEISKVEKVKRVTLNTDRLDLEINQLTQENLLFDKYTEDIMSPLLFHSDTEEIPPNTITLLNSQQCIRSQNSDNFIVNSLSSSDELRNDITVIENRNNQSILSQNSIQSESTQSSVKSDSFKLNVLCLNEKYCNTSSEIEIRTQKQTPIFISSSVENNYNTKNICKSPDIFADSDEEDEKKIVKKENYLKQKVNFSESVEIKKVLMKNTFDSELKSSIQMSTNNILTDNVFEITVNDDFPNIIRINSDTEMSPIILSDSDCDTTKKKIFIKENSVELFESQDSPGYISNRINVTITPTKKHVNENSAIKKITTPSSSISSESVTPTSAKWLSKRKSSPIKSIRNPKRRRNLQNWYETDKNSRKPHSIKKLQNRDEFTQLEKDMFSSNDSWTVLERRSGNKRKKYKILLSSDDEF